MVSISSLFMEYSIRTSSEIVCQMKCWSRKLIILNDLTAERVGISPLKIADCGSQIAN
jgi:hypothetical protein